MGIRTVNDPNGSPAVLVDHMLGNAYEVVRFVAKNVEFVKHVSAHMQQIYRVDASLAAIDGVNGHLEQIDTIIANLDAIVVLHTSINNINAVGNNINELIAVYSELNTILNAVQNTTAYAEAAELAMQSAALSSAEAGASSGRLDAATVVRIGEKFVYAEPGEGQEIAAAGEKALVRGDGSAFNIMDAVTPAHSTNADGYWEIPGVPGTIKVRGEQVPGGGFDLRQFNAKCSGADDSDAINYAAYVASQTATYAGIDPFRTTQSAALHVPCGVIGFDETITLHDYCHIIGQGRHQAVFKRLGSAPEGHCFVTRDFAALEADPDNGAILPVGIGLIGLTIQDGELNDAADSGKGLAIHATGTTIKGVSVFTPRRTGGFYMGKGVPGQITAQTDLISLVQTPAINIEDYVDQLVVDRAGGVGFEWRKADYKFGTIYVKASADEGVILHSGGQFEKIHSYINFGTNFVFTGQNLRGGELRVEDGKRGAAQFLGANVWIQHYRSNNNWRAVYDAGPEIPVEERVDTRISAMNVNLMSGEIKTSRGGPAIEYGGGSAIRSGYVKLRIMSHEAGSHAYDPAFEGKGSGVTFQRTEGATEVYSGLELDLNMRGFNDAGARGINIPGAIVEEGVTIAQAVRLDGCDIKARIDPYGAATFTVLQQDGQLINSDVSLKGRSDIYTMWDGEGTISDTNKLEFRDTAGFEDRKYARFTGQTSQFLVDATGFQSLTIPIQGGWLKGQLPRIISANIIPVGGQVDFTAQCRAVAAADGITVFVDVASASATVGANARVHVVALLGAL